MVQAGPWQKHETLSKKITKAKRVKDVVIEHLPSKCEALSSNPSNIYIYIYKDEFHSM
jgi:hypothetical protein